MDHRNDIAALILERLQQEKATLKKQFFDSKNQIGFFYVDNLLPDDLAKKIFNNFPNLNEVKTKKNLREKKSVGYEMNKYHPLLEEVIYAFQDQKIVDFIAETCELQTIFPDDNLYAGGLSMMRKGSFLSPHLDNSHDKDLKLWRVLNLLYYVSPNWKLENGGNLEIWPNGIKEKPITFESKFNRLVVMATHQQSWHSVNKVLVDDVRCCVSNYYFSNTPILNSDTFHITTFRGFPEEKMKDFLLQIDNSIRNFARKLFKKGVRKNPHQYKKDK